MKYSRKNKKTQERFIDYIYSLNYLSLKAKHEITTRYVDDVKYILSNFGITSPMNRKDNL